MPVTEPSVGLARSFRSLEKAPGKKGETRSGRNRAGLWSASSARAENARSQRLAVGGGSCWHPPARRAIEGLHVEKRHPTDGRRSGLQKKPTASRVAGACKLGRHDRIRKLRQRENKPTNGRRSAARRRQERQRLVRIESARSKSPRQVGRIHRSGLGVVKRWVLRARR